MKPMNVLVLLLAGAVSPAGHTAALPADAERGRIRTERAEVVARFADRERECKTRFVVTACVDAAQREKRDALARLRGQETVLDDAERKQRAADRLQEIEANRDRERAPRPTTPREPKEPSQPHPAIHHPPKPGTPHPSNMKSPKPVGGAVSPEERRQEEARSRATFEARQESAEKHRTQVENRNAERAVGRKVAAPLPVPGAASAP